jgi:hypothetical protein
VTVTVLVTVDVAAPPPSLTQIIMTSSTDELWVMRRLFPSLPLFPLLSDLLLLFPFPLLLPTERSVSTFTTPRPTKSDWRLPASTNGAAHNAVMLENLMMMYYKVGIDIVNRNDEEESRTAV